MPAVGKSSSDANRASSIKSIGVQSFKAAVKKGRTFITGGPIISLAVNGVPMGGVVRLPESGGEVEVVTELASPRLLRELQLIQGGHPLQTEIEKTQDAGIHRWRITRRVRFETSGWLSAWGKSARLEAERFDAIAHAGVVMVADRPLESRPDAEHLIKQLHGQREFYQRKGVYETESGRRHVSAIFDRRSRSRACRLTESTPFQSAAQQQRSQGDRGFGVFS